MSATNGRSRKLLFGANLFFIMCVAIITATLVWSLVHIVHRIDGVLEAVQITQAESAQQRAEHRVRNELLHSCIVELIYDVVEAGREGIGTVPNPCEAAQQTPPSIDVE